MHDDLIPAVSSRVTGPLGLRHLPRLWLKMVLLVLGRLPEGYRHGVGGVDELLLTNLGISADALEAYVRSDLPDYLTFESWVREHADVRPEAVARINALIDAGKMPDHVAAVRRAELSLPDDIDLDGTALNDLDDWAGIHQRVTRGVSPRGVLNRRPRGGRSDRPATNARCPRSW